MAALGQESRGNGQEKADKKDHSGSANAHGLFLSSLEIELRQ